jgi:Cof subfamily protein (haloacid dehalogenase superfamily)
LDHKALLCAGLPVCVTYGFRRFFVNKPVICFDFDGTLVDKNGWMHPADVDIFRNETDVLFVPATGRPLHAVRRAFSRNDLFVDSPLPFPLLLQNGAMVYLPGEKLYRQHVFSDKEQALLLAAGQNVAGITLLMFGPDQVRVIEVNDTVLAKTVQFQLTVTPFDPETEQMALTKLIYFADTHAELEQVLEQIKHLPLERHFSLDTVLEINQAGVNKGQSLANLLDGIGNTPATILAAGDGGNDLPMFEIADYSFAPASAPAAIKEQADSIVNIEQTGLLTPMLARL